MISALRWYTETITLRFHCEVQVSFLVALLPLLCAGVWTLLVAPEHAADPASAAVWAASIAGFVYIARATLSSNPNLAEQIDEAAGRLKDQLANSDVLKKAIAALTLSQQTAVENVKEVQDGTRALIAQLKAMKDEAHDAVASVVAERDRALRAEADAIAGLQEAYCTLWRLMGEGESSSLVGQVATEFERLYLPRVGLSAISEKGVAVDFRLHIVHGTDEPSHEVPPGAVVRVVRPGFRRRGEVIGRAEVVRARAPDVIPTSTASASQADLALGVAGSQHLSVPPVPEPPATPATPAAADSPGAGDDA